MTACADKSLRCKWQQFVKWATRLYAISQW